MKTDPMPTGELFEVNFRPPLTFRYLLGYESPAPRDGRLDQMGWLLVGDRFRADVEGMRAVAVGLVVLYHGFHAPFTGGFVGVDVFFVISGFLITSLLVHEKARTGRISISRFYARRVRRILPAATLVVLVVVFATFYWLGFIAGDQIADDAKWTAVFAANIHFGLLGIDYLGSQLRPSPLEHMWSLGVEEQFYLVWPALLLGLVLLVRGERHRNALAVTLLGIIGASLAWSVVETQSNATVAYFSPLTRAWELALGALVAVLSTRAARSTCATHRPESSTAPQMEVSVLCKSLSDGTCCPTTTLTW